MWGSRSEAAWLPCYSRAPQEGKAFHREYAEDFVRQRGTSRKQINNTFVRNHTTGLAPAVAMPI
jgi:hypothetical protein